MDSLYRTREDAEVQAEAGRQQHPMHTWAEEQLQCISLSGLNKILSRLQIGKSYSLNT